jgi:hypothetical protein
VRGEDEKYRQHLIRKHEGKRQLGRPVNRRVVLK